MENPDSAPPVISGISGHVATIVLNRPGQLNAITPDMDRLLREAVLAAQSNPACRVVVIRGAGKGFCSGADRAPAGAAASAATDWDQVPDRLERFRFGYLLESEKPIVAAINGAAIGVGLVLACCCDIRLASAAAKMSFPYTRLGLIAEYGIAKILPGIVGAGRARELLLSGRMITGADAERMGLVSQAIGPDEFDAFVETYAAELAQACSPRSLAVIKRQLDRARNLDFLQAVGEANTELQAARNSPDYAEASAARREKRLPVFSGE